MLNVLIMLYDALLVEALMGMSKERADRYRAWAGITGALT